MDIAILYEDDDVVVIDKPSGLSVHADASASSPEHTVASWHGARVPTALEVGEPLKAGERLIMRPGIVHRLDRETSGVLILAKHQPAFLFLKEQFKMRTAQKEYRAFVYGAMAEDHGTIDRPIGRSSKDFRLRSAQRGARGVLRDARTDWKRLAESFEHSYLAVFPKTGRTHQIRTHLKAINHPIVCDRLYAPRQTPALGFSRLALHARALSMPLPSGDTKTFTAPLPADFIEGERRIGYGGHGEA